MLSVRYVYILYTQRLRHKHMLNIQLQTNSDITRVHHF